jgi:hypothetical protein
MFAPSHVPGILCLQFDYVLGISPGDQGPLRGKGLRVLPAVLLTTYLDGLAPPLEIGRLMLPPLG